MYVDVHFSYIGESEVLMVEQRRTLTIVINGQCAVSCCCKELVVVYGLVGRQRVRC